MRRSGRRLAVISHRPNSSALAITAIVTSSLDPLELSRASCRSRAAGRRGSASASAEGTDCARRRKREPPWSRRTVARRALPSLAGPKPFGMRGVGAVSPGRVSVPWTTGEPSPGRISTYVPGVSTPNWARKLIRRSDAARAWPGPCRSNWSSDPATPFGARVERAVDAVEERRAQRRVGRDVGDQQPDRQEHGEHEQQARAQRHPLQRRSDAPAAAAAELH